MRATELDSGLPPGPPTVPSEPRTAYIGAASARCAAATVVDNAATLARAPERTTFRRVTVLGKVVRTAAPHSRCNLSPLVRLADQAALLLTPAAGRYRAT